MGLDVLGPEAVCPQGRPDPHQVEHHAGEPDPGQHYAHHGQRTGRAVEVTDAQDDLSGRQHADHEGHARGD